MKRIPIGSGCKTCPVNPCETLTYRGSTCAAQRAKHGLGDPLTHADRIRAMSDEELAAAIWAAFNDNDYLGRLFCDGKAGCLLECGDFDCDENKEKDCVLRWLQRPAEVSGDG